MICSAFIPEIPYISIRILHSFHHFCLFVFPFFVVQPQLGLSLWLFYSVKTNCFASLKHKNKQCQLCEVFLAVEMLFSEVTNVIFILLCLFSFSSGFTSVCPLVSQQERKRFQEIPATEATHKQFGGYTQWFSTKRYFVEKLRNERIRRQASHFGS